VLQHAFYNAVGAFAVVVYLLLVVDKVIYQFYFELLVALRFRL